MSDRDARVPRPVVRPAPDEVSIFIDPDGNVTICDLWDDLLPVAEAVGDIVPAAVCPYPGPDPASGDR